MPLDESTLHITISDLRRDLDEAKQDKHYLLEHNQEMKQQLAHLKEERRLALARPQAPVLGGSAIVHLSPPTDSSRGVMVESSPLPEQQQLQRSATEEVESSPESLRRSQQSVKR